MSPNNESKVWQELKNKVTFLKRSDSYKEECSTVEAIETHMSWVFLTDQYAYKLKKPVKFPLLDLSQLKTRYLNCHKELRLNQFLAPGIYLGVIPIIQDKHGQFCPIGQPEEGTTVDWLLQMRRFPRDLTLDQVILRNCIDKFLVTKAAQILTKFYQKANPVRITPTEYKDRLRKYIQENLKILTTSKYGLNRALVKSIHQTQLNELNFLSEKIDKRVYQGRIIECHGDLRPEHICLTSPPIIIDRLEFSDELRTMDPVDELSYLSLECELLGRADIGTSFFDAYQEETKDNPPARLLSFYKSYRACLRAKISIWHLDDPRVKNSDWWHKRANSYLDLSTAILD